MHFQVRSQIEQQIATLLHFTEMKTEAQLTHSKTQTHGSNFDKCTHVPTKKNVAT
jgi:hypothetical protein